MLELLVETVITGIAEVLVDVATLGVGKKPSRSEPTSLRRPILLLTVSCVMLAVLHFIR